MLLNHLSSADTPLLHHSQSFAILPDFGLPWDLLQMFVNSCATIGQFYWGIPWNGMNLLFMVAWKLWIALSCAICVSGCIEIYWNHSLTTWLQHMQLVKRCLHHGQEIPLWKYTSRYHCYHCIDFLTRIDTACNFFPEHFHTCPSTSVTHTSLRRVCKSWKQYDKTFWNLNKVNGAHGSLLEFLWVDWVISENHFFRFNGKGWLGLHRGYMEVYMQRNFFRGSALATWLGFTATFAARPLGGMFIGMLSDAFGRKLAVVITVIGMLTATVGQGLLPTPRRWGEDSAMGNMGLCLLFCFRLVQGLCTGGEIASVSTYIAEVAGQKSMGRCISCVSMSCNVGFVSARAVIWAVESCLGPEAMIDYGWRWPFLLSSIPGVISVWGRLFCLKESELFEEEHVSESEEEKEAPIMNPREGARKSTRRHLQEFACTHYLEVLIGIGGVVSFAVFQYGGMVWANSFLEKHGASENYVMMAGIGSRLLQIILAFPVGWLADTHGMALVTFAGALVQTCAGLPLFMALHADPRSVTNLFVTYTVGYALIASCFTTIFMFCAELFPTAVRNLGVGVSFNVGFGFCGGFAPLVAEASLDWSPYGPGLLLSCAGAITCITMLSAVALQRAGKVQLAHIRPRPYFGTWADGEIENFENGDFK